MRLSLLPTNLGINLCAAAIIMHRDIDGTTSFRILYSVTRAFWLAGDSGCQLFSPKHTTPESVFDVSHLKE
jgi:hypothetical protein